MATIKEIAETLNLSSATVSRALRNDETLSITAETKSKIFMTADKLGYVAKGKKMLTQNPESNITVLHKKQTFRNQIDSSYYFSVRTGIEDACTKHQILCNFITIDALSSYHNTADGILIVGNYSLKDFQLFTSHFPSLPMATTGIISYYPERIDHITHSNYDSLSMALEHLFENGHTQIGYLGVEEAPGTIQFGSRKEIFKQILVSHNCFHPEWVYESKHGKDRVERGYATMKGWISKRQTMPTALFCANDPIALGALKALNESGIRVPDDISIVAHDGSYPTQYSQPPLSTIDVHPYQIGYEAVNILWERMSGERKIAKKVSFYPELLDRQSVKNFNINP
ncbi:LacI family DNA-binding transcriptional regulator [uncultured Robinsoniella sp.]|uniref:LacI family DNA-binding transcriptional regulator n=1 Tax=uncultured Robinsoniella sp. TaxID=904190 RepID=UPI00374FBDEC